MNVFGIWLTAADVDFPVPKAKSMLFAHTYVHNFQYERSTKKMYVRWEGHFKVVDFRNNNKFNRTYNRPTNAIALHQTHQPSIIN